MIATVPLIQAEGIGYICALINQEITRMLYKQMARITIEPQWARYYDFGAGRVPGFLRKLAEDHPASDG